MAEQLPTIYLDLDGTILDVRRRYYAVYTAIALDLGVEPETDYRFWEHRRQGVPTDWLIASMGDSARKEFGRRWLEEIEQDAYLDMDELLPQAFEALTFLRMHYRLILVTMRRERHALMRQLVNLGIYRFFSAIISPPNNKNGSVTKAELILNNVPPVKCPR